MRKRVAGWKMLIVASPAVLLALSPLTTAAAAGSLGPKEKHHARTVAQPAPQHHRHLVRSEFVTSATNGAPYRSVPRGVSAYREPGRVYVPGAGIRDEACNLPTSACPNEMRDIQ